MGFSTSPLYPDSGTADALKINGTPVSGLKPANGQTLVYSSSIDEYVPQTPSGGGGAQGPIAIILSATPPSSPTEGMTWFDETTLRTYVRYDSTWVETVSGYATLPTPILRRYAADSSNAQIYYAGKAADGTADSSGGWEIKRTTLNNSGAISATATASGVWNNRESLTYA
jgi:hypothetical protein